MLLNRYAGAILLAASLHGAAAAAPEPKTRAEIAHLLDYVATPGCQFNRNGSWHEGAEARAHLKKKYDYLVKRDLVTNAESFIERGATESSMSGKPYQVKCGGGKAVASSVYLTEELKRFREKASK
jgi:hypothetical protein